MKLPHPNQIKINSLALAFSIPFVCILCLMMIGGYEPFGDRSMLYSDMYHQYYPFFVSFRKALLSGESLLYSWNIGMGLDHLGLIAYYLASPLNLLSVLIPESWTLEYFSLLVPTKLGLASLFFAIFLKKIFRKKDISIAFFGAFYGLCAWALGYQWNVMWLDTFALLPLVALGTVALLRDKKFVLYTVTLFLSICSNYYIGLFTCIFVLLLFICYQICRCTSIKRFFLDLCRIALFSVLAIGMTAFLELPALAALMTTQSSVNNFPENFQLNIADRELYSGVNLAWESAKAAWNENRDFGEAAKFGWEAITGAAAGIMDGMRKVAGNTGGGLVPSFKEGLPNLYTGIGTMILAFLFLTAKKVKVRDKICSVLMLMFLMVSCIIRQLDYVWHGFHFTNMIPYRFSFLFSFIMLYMAYRAYLMRREFAPWKIVLAGVLSIGLLSCSEQITDTVYLAYNGVFLLLYLTVLLYCQIFPKPYRDATEEEQLDYLLAQIDRRSLASLGMLGIMALELILNVINFGVNFPYTTVTNYPKGTEDTVSAIEYLNSRPGNDLFFRTETTHSQTLNDGALNGYYGISTFTSSANVRVTEFMKALGYGAKNTYNRYCFEESSPVANLFLNLKYMLERDGNVEDNDYFTDLYSFGKVHLLENNAYLPLGFLANSRLAEMDFSIYQNRFGLQNDLLITAAGVEGNVWRTFNGKVLTISSLKDSASIANKTSTGYCSYTTEGQTDIISYKYDANRSGFLCLDLTLSARNSYSVYRNGALLFTETYSLPQMIAISQIEIGDTIEIRFNCKANERGTLNARAYVMDDAIFQAAYRTLSASTLELTKFTNTYVEGTIRCNRDGLLYTSIPQNGNWSAEVDGEPAEITLVGNAMIAVPMTEGEHTVTFTYRNRAFEIGCTVSVVCLTIFACLTLLIYKPERRRGKYERIK